MQVVLVEDLEAARIADGAAIAPEEPRAYRVESSRPYRRDLVANELLGTLAHLARGAVGKGKKKYAIGGNALLYEKRDAVDERARLAGSCGSEDEKRPFARRSRRALLGVKQFREICHPQYYTIPQRPKSSLELEVEL